MGLISFGRQQERDLVGNKGDCGCGCAGKGDCGDKAADATMGGPFTEGVSTGVGVALGLVGAGALLSWILHRRAE